MNSYDAIAAENPVHLLLRQLELPFSAPPLLGGSGMAAEYTARQIKCAPFLDIEALSPAQRADFDIGVTAVEAFWKSVHADPFWLSPSQYPMRRCILAGLAVRDTLRAMGRPNAVAVPVGLQLIQMDGDEELKVLTIGEPGAPYIENGWNAHMVVKLGDILLDPSCGQAQRAWNAAPHAAALLLENKKRDMVSLFDWGKANVKARHRYSHNGYQYSTAYFDLTRSVVQRTRDWMETPDARPERRKALVEAAAGLLRGTRTLDHHQTDFITKGVAA